MPKGMNTLGFISGCPSSDSKTQLNTAGWRIHVFVDRQFSEMTVLKNLVGQFSKESEKLNKSRKPVPDHYKINTLASYASCVYNVYSGKVGNVEQLYQNIESGCSVSPSALFCMKEMEGSIYDLDDYKNETNEFVFPSSNFLRLDTESINVKHFASASSQTMCCFLSQSLNSECLEVLGFVWSFNLTGTIRITTRTGTRKNLKILFKHTVTTTTSLKKEVPEMCLISERSPTRR